MSYVPQSWSDGSAGNTPITAARLANIESGIQAAAQTADTAFAAAGASSGLVGAVSLDSFSGSTDDARLTAAMNYASSQTIKPPILLSNRIYSFSANRTLYSGFKLIGPYAFGDQQRGANSIPFDARFTGTGTWWTVPSGSTFDVQFQGIGFQGNSSSTFINTASGGVLWTSLLRDLGFNLWNGVLGNNSVRMSIDGIVCDGFWNINNSYGTAIHVGGSDCWLFTGSVLCDTPQSIGNNFAGQYHMWFDYLEKTVVGPIYMTADKVSGIRVLGNDGNGQLIFTGARVEGRNAGVPCYGSNVRIDGGGVTFRDSWISYGASALNTTGHTGEGGVITITGGRALFDGCWYDRASSVAETVPWIYQSGGFVRIRNAMTATKGGTWSTNPGKPSVHSVGGVMDADSSVSII